MTRDGPYYTRIGGESMRLPHAMVWIVVDELPMRLAMYGYAGRMLVLSLIVALFTASLLYLALRWLVIRPLQDLSEDMTAFRRAPEEAATDRPPTDRPSTGRDDEIGAIDREFRNLQRELRASLRQKSRLAEVGAASNKINHDLRNMLSTARLLSDRLARDDERTRKLAPTILNTIDRATRLASEAIEYVRDRPVPRVAEFDFADLVDEVGVALQEQGEEHDPNTVRHWTNTIEGERRLLRGDRDLLYRVLANLGRNAFDAGATEVRIAARASTGYLLVDVADNGRGVPPEIAPQLFRPFTTGGRAGGAGLGLCIARELVRAHAGEIVLSDTGTTGTTFQFTLPLGSN
jgi:signal transduction histidine kinase